MYITSGQLVILSFLRASIDSFNLVRLTLVT